jgi:hypothetical protein
MPEPITGSVVRHKKSRTFPAGRIRAEFPLVEEARLTAQRGRERERERCNNHARTQTYPPPFLNGLGRRNGICQVMNV